MSPHSQYDSIGAAYDAVKELPPPATGKYPLSGRSSETSPGRKSWTSAAEPAITHAYAATTEPDTSTASTTPPR